MLIIPIESKSICKLSQIHCLNLNRANVCIKDSPHPIFSPIHISNLLQIRREVADALIIIFQRCWKTEILLKWNSYITWWKEID